ncbi:MAG TPA: hypothetical protein DEP48_07095 [Persephonella sp.]|nr:MULTISPECIES: hypothetical protein [Persephonella]HCB70109.1 hypothetical protein [Persephonella sp.]
MNTNPEFERNMNNLFNEIEKDFKLREIAKKIAHIKPQKEFDEISNGHVYMISQEEFEKLDNLIYEIMAMSTSLPDHLNNIIKLWELNNVDVKALIYLSFFSGKYMGITIGKDIGKLESMNLLKTEFPNFLKEVLYKNSKDYRK